MREILFRGQTRKYGEKVRMCDGQKLPGHWVYGGVLQGVGDRSIIYGGENENDPSEGLDKCCVHTDTLGQFTGLTDKNGKKIFEGDVVAYCWYEAEPMNFQIEFVSTEFLAVPVMKREDVWSIRISGRGEDLEVVGNIHDNPNLLEGGVEDGK